MKKFQKQYTDELVEIIEFLYGQDYLSQGGSESINFLLRNEQLENKILADIGCGSGGPAIYMAQNFPLQKIIGIDVDEDLLKKAQQRANNLNIADKITWKLSVPEEKLPLEDASVDIVFGKESWLHIANKVNFFKDLFRVLKPGGKIITIDWMHAHANYSNLMHEFAIVDGLNFNFCTIDEYCAFIKQAGFTNIQLTDISDKALSFSRQDVEKLLDNKIKQNFCKKFGDHTYELSLRSWLMQCEIFAKGEMQVFIVKVTKP